MTVPAFDSETVLLGMVHLPPLPGAPRYDGDRREMRASALADALALAESGFDGLLVENFGDAPFYPEDVPKHVVAELTATVRELSIAIDVPFGVNVLRNDAEAAMSVAAATGGSFVRVNVHTGVRATDQGQITGRAHETLRLRERLDADVAILADVDVKHSAAVADRDIAAVATETIDRGLADALVVSGPATGEAADDDRLRAVVDARDDADRAVPVLVGSGVTVENAPALLERTDGAIVGTAIKHDGETTNPVDPERASELVEAVRDW
jgi:membrane complex biogenesis BtpA family protein